jgi:flagellar assembly protein FliH
MSSNGRVSQFEYPNVMEAKDDRMQADAGAIWADDEHKQRNQRDEQGLREAQAREIGRHEGEAKAKVQFEEAMRKERGQLLATIEQFRLEREKYFEQVEGEVVQLALGIARKVLHREAQVDPGLLAGLVRFTLEKLRDGTVVRLRVHPSQNGYWERECLTNCEVVSDEKVEPSACVVETEVGRTRVELEAQLKEIEQGLFDLMARAPARSR